MTITNTTRSITYTGNSSTTVWSYSFEIPDAASANVKLVEISNGIETVISAANYTITGLGIAAGGTVTYPKSGTPLASTHKIVVYRNVAPAQTVNITNQTKYNASVVMDVWDRLTMVDQEIIDDVKRSVRSPIGEASISELPAVAQRSGKLLAFDTSGNPVAAVDSPNVTTTVLGITSRVFDTVADMVASTDNIIGDTVETRSYTTVGDGGGNSYSIVAAATGTVDGGSYIDLTGISGQAKGLFSGEYSPMRWGAVGDGVTDDKTKIEAMLTYLGTVASNPYFSTPAKVNLPLPIIVNGNNKYYAMSGQITLTSVNGGIIFTGCNFKAIAGTWATNGGNPSTITGATQANPVSITSTAYGFKTGDSVLIESVVGMTELNGNTYAMTSVDANTYTLDGIDGTAFTAYTSGGEARSQEYAYRPKKSDYFFKASSSATFVVFDKCNFDCANLCGGVALRARSRIRDSYIKHCAGVGVENLAGDVYVEQCQIDQWLQSDVEYFDNTAYTGIGVMSFTSDIRVTDTVVRWLKECVRFDSTNCHIWGGHIFNGCNGYLAADRTANATFDAALEAYFGLGSGTVGSYDFPVRTRNVGIVTAGGTSADNSFNNVYLDNCHNEHYNDRAVYNSPKLGHKSGSTITGMVNYWWKFHCHTNNATPVTRVFDIQPFVETGAKTHSYDFANFDGNSWLVNYAWLEGNAVNAVTSPEGDGLTFAYPYRHITPSGQGQNPAVTYVAPTGGSFIGFADNSTTLDGSGLPLPARIGAGGDNMKFRAKDFIFRSQDSVNERFRVTDQGSVLFQALSAEPASSANGEMARSDGTSSTNGFGTSGAGIYEKRGGTWYQIPRYEESSYTVFATDASGNSVTTGTVVTTRRVGGTVTYFFEFVINVSTAGLTATDQLRFTTNGHTFAQHSFGSAIVKSAGTGTGPYSLQAVNGQAYFKIYDEGLGRDLLVSDFTTGVTDIRGGTITVIV